MDMLDIFSPNPVWGYIGTVLLVCLGTYLLIRLSMHLVDIDSKRKTIRVMNKERITVDITRHQFLKHSMPPLIALTGIGIIIYIIPPLRAASSSWLAGAGILALVIGFASQQAVSNLVAGIFIAIFKPFRVGDWITVGKDSGIVEDINLRQTQIVDFNNRRVVIPNSIISNDKILNYDIEDKKICEFLDLKISFDSDIEKAKKIVVEECQKNELFHDNRTEQQKKDGVSPVYIYVREIGEYFIQLRAMVWSKDSFSGWYMRVDLLEKIKARFEKEGIEIPYPQNAWVRKPPRNMKKK